MIRPAAKAGLKWVGGKRKLLPQYAPHFPDPATFRGAYFEPFLGGGSVFFDFASRGFCGRATLGDINPHLFRFYAAVRRQPGMVWARLNQLALCHMEAGPYEKVGAGGGREKFFYKIRSHWNTIVPNLPHGNQGEVDDCAECIDVAALMLYLNATAINGLWRENSKGLFNASFGDYESPSFRSWPELEAISKCLDERVILFRADYFTTCSGAKAGDLLYLDPPYVPVNQTSNFVSYSKGGFNQGEQERLAIFVRSLVKRGCIVRASNSDTPLVRELYEGLGLVEIQAGRSINRDKEKRGPVGELLICGN